LRIVPLHAPEGAAPAPLARPRRFAYSIAAAIAVLVLAGIGAIWSQSSPAVVAWTRVGTAPLVLNEVNETAAPADFGASTVGIAAASPRKRLGVAVARMEDYYATQITEKKQEISALNVPAATAPSNDWNRELTTLDSTYTQLKTELYRNPEPDVVLEAMNRNLQIRLDILNQQLRLQERMKEYSTNASRHEND
jgi:hypothetical protein